MSSDKLMSLSILTPEKTLYQGKIQKITVPGEKSPFQVLYNHAPILSTLTSGKVVCTDEKDKEHTFLLKSGIVEVVNNEVTITADIENEKTVV